MTQYATDLAGIALVASATSLALGLLARATGLSPAIGYILAGVMVGQHTPGPVVDPKVAAELATAVAPVLMLHLGWSVARTRGVSVLVRSVPAAAVPLAVAGGAGWGLGHLLGLDAGAALAFALVLVACGGSLTARGRGSRSPALLDLAIAAPAIVLAGAGFLLPMVNEGPLAVPRMVAASAAIFLSLRILGPGLVAALSRDVPEAGGLVLLVVGLGGAVVATALTGLPLPAGAFVAGLALARVRGGAGACHVHPDPLRAVPRVTLLVCVGALLDPAVLAQQPAAFACAVGIALLGPSLAVRLAGGAPDGAAPAAAASTADRVEVAPTVACVTASAGLLVGPAWDLAIGAALLSCGVLSMLGRQGAAGAQGT